MSIDKEGFVTAFCRTVMGWQQTERFQNGFAGFGG